ncbi:uncharacterized protein LOC119681887 [Teleopsis dalmanni]|uniref:uncharacterized protein LOC119681887 n=1 Tax=Teleopsis dalmanni TaxID=139649 RepID=UPI0018CDC839|nr:uncharacterized protein LOC119681887 [Teleopsis dalmanni]
MSYFRLSSVLNNCVVSFVGRTNGVRLGVNSVSKRFINYRKDCAIRIEPRCSEENIKKSKCMKDKLADAKNKKKEYPFKNLIYRPECCVDICPDPFPRFDDLYYKESDKKTRIYMRTWANCEPPPPPKKLTCRFKKTLLPLNKREELPDVACWQPCEPKGPKKCTRICLPGCKKARHPSKCFVIKKPSDCKKRCTKYPSFSECKRPPLRKGRPVECNCLKAASLCEVFNYLRKLTERPKD